LHQPPQRSRLGGGQTRQRVRRARATLYGIEARALDALVTDERDRARTARRMGQGDHFGKARRRLRAAGERS
jgi:hypothetical protein